MAAVDVVWDPLQYGRFSEERGRPFFDLVGRVQVRAPSLVVDLGCGTGDLTASLRRRWPRAQVLGIDSSPEMIERARRLAGDGLSFELADIREWRPPRPISVLVSNAALQWVPGHLELLAGWVAALEPGGWLALQVPRNLDAPHQRELAALAVTPPWRGRVPPPRPEVPAPEEYLERLVGLGCRVDLWETVYLHVLHGPDAVFEWARGTALRPVLSRLVGADRQAFLDEYRRRLRRAYPERPWGTLLPFRRLFAVANLPPDRSPGPEVRVEGRPDGGPPG